MSGTGNLRLKEPMQAHDGLLKTAANQHHKNNDANDSTWSQFSGGEKRFIILFYQSLL